VQCRVATLVDAEQIATIQVRGWHAAYRGILPDRTLDAMDVADRTASWDKGLAEQDPGRCTFVCLDHGNAESPVTGFVAAGSYRELDGDEPGDHPDGEIYAIYVDPDRWRSGSGRCLISAAEQFLRDRGHATAGLWVLEANQASRAFYEAMGWVVDGARRAGRPHVEAPEVRYERDLTS
jgi:GNAT superfamily N-acetyltransferase